LLASRSSFGKTLGNLNLFARDSYPRDLRAELGGEIAGRAAYAAANIQNAELLRGGRGCGRQLGDFEQ